MGQTMSFLIRNVDRVILAVVVAVAIGYQFGPAVVDKLTAAYERITAEDIQPVAENPRVANQKTRPAVNHNCTQTPRSMAY